MSDRRYNPGSYEDTVRNHPYMTHELSKSGWLGRIKFAVEEINREKYRETLGKYFDRDNNFKDPNRMLATALTTIILLALGKTDIPKPYFMWSELYLRCVKDDFGEYPPNIRQLLGFIRNKRKRNDISWEDVVLDERDVKQFVKVARKDNILDHCTCPPSKPVPEVVPVTEDINKTSNNGNGRTTPKKFSSNTSSRTSSRRLSKPASILSSVSKKG